LPAPQRLGRNQFGSAGPVFFDQFVGRLWGDAMLAREVLDFPILSAWYAASIVRVALALVVGHVFLRAPPSEDKRFWPPKCFRA
jgi:hypothetical protein